MRGDISKTTIYALLPKQLSLLPNGKKHLQGRENLLLGLKCAVSLAEAENRITENDENDF